MPSSPPGSSQSNSLQPGDRFIALIGADEIYQLAFVEHEYKGMYLGKSANDEIGDIYEHTVRGLMEIEPLVVVDEYAREVLEGHGCCGGMMCVPQDRW